MKKVFLLLAAFCLAIAGHAQITTYSCNDANLDGQVDISDVNGVISEICGNGKSVRVVSVDSICALLRTINTDVAKQVEKKLGISNDPVIPTPTSSNLLPGKFSVSSTKQVQFTKSNLYWDGSTFKFEASQTDCPNPTDFLSSMDANHVSHFYWTNLTDYQSGTASYMPYAKEYSYSSQSTSDKFWCCDENPLTVEGTDSLYVLTGSSTGEWYYLIKRRTNASSLYKYGVTVTNGGKSYTNCLVIAPDDYTGTLQSSYTLDEVNAAVLVCLPAAGNRYGSYLNYGGTYGWYWSATPDDCFSDVAYDLDFGSDHISLENGGSVNFGYSLRLVRPVSTPTTHD